MRSRVSLLQILVLGVAFLGCPARANSVPYAYEFSNLNIRFDNDTQVEFSFVESHSKYESTLHLLSVGGSDPPQILFAEVRRSDRGATNDWEGTFGRTVLGSQNVSVLLSGGQSYTLALEGLNGNNPGPTVYSTSALNGGLQRAIFSSNDPFMGPVNIDFDDLLGGGDQDFNDFQIQALAHASAVPELEIVDTLDDFVAHYWLSIRHSQN